MKRNAYKTIFGVIAVAALCAGFGLAKTEPQHDHSDPPARPDLLRPDLLRLNEPSMKNEPHRVLAMAYLQSAGTFARALSEQAQAGSQLSSDFARAAVAEIRRNLDQADEHQREHIKAMGDDMHSRMPKMLSDMDMHRSMLTDAVRVLEKDVQDYTLNSRRIVVDSATVIRHLDEMQGMHKPE